VYVDGLAASAASIIALAGDKVIIPENAFFMIHHAWATATGNAHDLENVLAMLNAMDSAMISVYMDSAKVSREEIVAYMDKETWFTGTEAAEIFNKISTSPAVEIAAKADVSTLERFRNTPDNFVMANRKANALTQIERERLALLDMKGGQP
jgi:hypothetical protein